ncbi:imidazole glycerol phosphate synthase subunit HisH [Cronbergia sp. UHCC 0137]|uniref:imidazole glycerol phosphate synthase subunit HisH n=1 Tax=Cronbergia sp. UHCC 0137 TaxID=3110239 RepID=UPI002B212085|nr:imidazole glycerol phosphate synthase subunit HisH [Cronbergia sp. UHCC 0137]MEA5616580.1 imidazole glycerol phosphate synthase subunit HisH [Cronbergia sp. UHCC 0137]
MMNKHTITIIDYGMGNLRSVYNAFASFECSVNVTQNPEDLYQASHIVLPGVGAFGDGIKNLEIGGWIKVLEKEVREKGKPFLGICLGMQLLATTGTEYGLHKGLNWIPGTVNRLEINNDNNDSVRIPHIGWNDVNFVKKDCLYKNLGESQVFYFVHSYVFNVEEEGLITGLTTYGSDFVASLKKANIYATQFHPEKSQNAGIELLKNFVDLI